jgi:hypothetical protein
MEFESWQIYAINKLLPQYFKIEQQSNRKTEIEHLEQPENVSLGKRNRRQKKVFEFEDPQPQKGEVHRKALQILLSLKTNKQLKKLLPRKNRMSTIEDRLRRHEYTNTSEFGSDVRNMFISCYRSNT